MSDTRFERVRERLAEWNPEALLADGFEEALIGITHRKTLPPLALYDYEKCVQILMARDGMNREGAVEFLEFNTLDAWVGEGTPVFAYLEVDDG